MIVDQDVDGAEGNVHSGGHESSTAMSKPLMRSASAVTSMAVMSPSTTVNWMTLRTRPPGAHTKPARPLTVARRAVCRAAGKHRRDLHRPLGRGERAHRFGCRVGMKDHRRIEDLHRQR